MLKSIDGSQISISDRRQGGRERRQSWAGSESLFGMNLYSAPAADRVLPEESFHRMIAIERKRSERSRKPFLLLLLDTGTLFGSDRTETALARVVSSLASSTRETDVTGWYKNGSVFGVMFTELDSEIDGLVLEKMMNRVSDSLRNHLDFRKVGALTIRWQLYPEHCDSKTSIGNPVFYPDVLSRQHSQRLVLTIKRLIDIVGSCLAICLFCPIFLLLAALVKSTSRGPVIFRQSRLGQFGKPFNLLKFRSMHANNDETIHQQFITKVIKGQHGATNGASGEPVYKMTNDPRITRFGSFLRRTSLDELPQFFNVLKGDMSLVGPRPPLAYEYKEYDLWHRRRVLEVKPGITGLWQVRGRSRVRFDDMVRLDLEYVRNWSLWLDLRILLQTPRAVIFGGDAF